MEKKTKTDIVLATAAVAGFSTALLMNLQFNAKEGLKIGKSIVSVSSSKAEAQNCGCCNGSGSGGCAGR